MSRREILNFVNAAHFFDHFFLLIFPTAALALAPAWDLSYGEALVLGTPIYALFALGTLPAGWLGDRFDRMKLMIVFFLGCGASSLLAAISTGPVSLMVALGLLGLFAALYHPVGLALITDIGQRTGRALAINGVFGNLGLAAAAVTSGFLATQFGWRSAFILPGILSIIIGAVLTVRQTRRSAVVDTGGNRVAPPAYDTGRREQITVFGVICVAALFGGTIFNAVTISLPKFFAEQLTDVAGNLSWIGASAGGVFAVAAFAQLPVGELLDKYGARPILLCLLSVQIALFALLTQMTGWGTFVVALVLIISIFAEIPITSWLLGRYIRSGLRSRAVSVEYVLSLGVGSAIVPSIAYAHRAGYGYDVQIATLALCAAIIFVAALFLPIGPVRQPTDSQSTDRLHNATSKQMQL